MDEKYTNEQIKKLQNEAREEFIKRRTKKEVAFNEWIKQFQVLSPEEKAELGITEDISFQKLFPEYYKDIPNKEQYDLEYQKLTEFMERLNAKCDRLFEEGKKALEEYNAIHTG